MTHDAFFTRHNDALRHYDAFQMTRPKMRHNDAFLGRIFYFAAYEQKRMAPCERAYYTDIWKGSTVNVFA